MSLHRAFREVRIISTVLIVLTACAAVAQDLKSLFPQSFTVEVSNPLDLERHDVYVHISAGMISKVNKKFNRNAFVVLYDGREIASQYNDENSPDPGIVLVLDKLASRQTVTLVVRYNKKGTAERDYVKRTYAELSHKTGGKFVNREYIGGAFKNVQFLRVPKEHKDHSWFIRYEGPGWESDKVGYRFYLDQRNATDVFGKKTSDMILHLVGQDGFDSYHEMQPWGMDVMKVGKSLGIGSIGYNDNGKIHRVEKTDSVASRIVRNGDVFSAITADYFGWQVPDNKVSLKATLSIHAGARHTRADLDITNGSLARLATGIVRDDKAKLITSGGNKDEFAFVATYGKQSLNDDDLGLAVLFSADLLDNFGADDFSHVVNLKVPRGTGLRYYFLAAWSGEPGGIADEQNFLSYVHKLARELANPVRLTVKK